MYLWIIAVVAAAAAVFALIFAYLLLRRVKRQISEMADVLEEVRAGNGNRRILARSNELTAPLAYGINEIVLSYEEQLLAYRQAEETNKQLMTSLSHDVRTPLTTLIGYLDAVHKKAVVGHERDEYVKIARRKAHDLKEYIDMLFDWFKLNSDEFALDLRTVEMTELTRDILIDWILLLEDRQIAYAVEIPEQPLWVRLDPDGYRRILNNLLQNVLAHSQADQIEVILSKQGDVIRLSLADNGVGLDPEDLKHIFERLYKCDKGRAKKGSGLGLSIVRQLTEKMGGKISAESEKGRGTVFTLSFSDMQG